MFLDGKIAIVGGNGFVGSNFSKLYKSNNVIIDNLFLKKDQRSENIINLDINNAGNDEWSELFDKYNIEIVINLAAIHSIPYCNKHPEQAIYTNTYGNSKLFDFCIKKKIKHYIFASTGAVYMPTEKIHFESSIQLGSDIYSYSKILSEKYLKCSSSNNPIKTTVLRFFNIVGRYDFTPHLLPDLYDQFVSNEDELLVGNLNTVRDYIHVEDVCALLKYVLNSELDYTFEEFNVCTGIETSGFEILEIMSKIFNSNKKTVVDKLKLRKSDRPYQVGSYAKANKFFGWKPKKTLEIGINDFIKWKKMS